MRKVPAGIKLLVLPRLVLVFDRGAAPRLLPPSAHRPRHAASRLRGLEGEPRRGAFSLRFAGPVLQTQVLWVQLLDGFLDLQPGGLHACGWWVDEAGFAGNPH